MVTYRNQGNVTDLIIEAAWDVWKRMLRGNPLFLGELMHKDGRLDLVVGLVNCLKVVLIGGMAALGDFDNVVYFGGIFFGEAEAASSAKPASASKTFLLCRRPSLEFAPNNWIDSPGL